MFSKCFNFNLLFLIYICIISFINLANLVEASYLGCYFERSGTARLMPDEYVHFKGTNTPELCIQHCRSKGFAYAGVQFGFECFCSKRRPAYRYSAEEEECTGKCEGDESQICGGPNRMNVYETFELQRNPVEKNYVGCMDTSKRRVLSGKSKIFAETLTPEMCVAFCYRSGYRFAALQNRECYCGNSLNDNSLVNDDECNIHCGGENKKFICGGQTKSSVYTTGITGYAEQSGLLGCYEDSPSRLLSGFSIKYPENNSAKLCFNVCLASGFKYAGVQIGNECHCGNVKPDAQFKRAESDCAIPCPGEPTSSCGGAWRIYIYTTKWIMNDLSRKKGCKEKVLFEEDFSSLSPDKWRPEIRMPWAPDYEFVVLNNRPENVFIRDGKLVIKPILVDEDFVQRGKISLNRCTGAAYTEECEREATGFHILPPVESGKVTTRDTFSFKYGKIQIRAKVPSGDWIVPEIWLEPKRNVYGPNLASGRIKIAMSRGNKNLVVDERQIGNKQVESGIVMGVNDKVRARTIIKDHYENWSNDFHNYTLVWAPDYLNFTVDNEPSENLISPGIPLSDSMGFDRHTASRWKSGSPIAPFDQEFYISLGLSVGGMREFPDGSISGNIPKPWTNKAVKAMLLFWQDRKNWHRTWDDNSALQVDHVRVTKI